MLRRSVEIEDEVGLGLGIVFPSADLRTMVRMDLSSLQDDDQFVRREGVGGGDEGTILMRSEDLESEISSMLGSENAVIGTAEIVVLRVRRVPEEWKERVSGWIGEVEKIWDKEDGELFCIEGCRNRNKRRARGEIGTLDSEREIEMKV